MIGSFRKQFLSHGRYIDVVIERDSSGGFHALAYVDEPVEINGSVYGQHSERIRAKLDEILADEEPSKA